ncbi:MAG: hypothetical protein JHC33_03035 [Ignisphaera sp.]|nr:hypothetical protein [Ignisphaera sp.]
MSDEPRYMATINGANVGMFSSISEADTAAMQALARGFAGPHVMNEVRRIEVRDTKNSYQLVSSRNV